MTNKTKISYKKKKISVKPYSNSNKININIKLQDTKKKGNTKRNNPKKKKDDYDDDKKIIKNPVMIPQYMPSSYGFGGLIARDSLGNNLYDKKKDKNKNLTTTNGINQNQNTNIPKREPNKILEVQANKLKKKYVDAIDDYMNENNIKSFSDFYVVKNKVFQTEEEAQEYADRKGINKAIKKVIVPPFQQPQAYTLPSSSYSPYLQPQTKTKTPSLTPESSFYAPFQSQTPQNEEFNDEVQNYELNEVVNNVVDQNQEYEYDEFLDENHDENEVNEEEHEQVNEYTLEDISPPQSPPQSYQLSPNLSPVSLQERENVSTPNLEPQNQYTAPTLEAVKRLDDEFNEPSSSKKRMTDEEIKEQADGKTMTRDEIAQGISSKEEEKVPQDWETIVTSTMKQNNDNGKFSFTCPNPDCSYDKEYDSLEKAYKGIMFHVRNSNSHENGRQTQLDILQKSYDTEKEERIKKATEEAQKKIKESEEALKKQRSENEKKDADMMEIRDLSNQFYENEIREREDIVKKQLKLIGYSKYEYKKDKTLMEYINNNKGNSKDVESYLKKTLNIQDPKSTSVLENLAQTAKKVGRPKIKK